jgi:hypothetical protein
MRRSLAREGEPVADLTLWDIAKAMGLLFGSAAVSYVSGRAGAKKPEQPPERLSVATPQPRAPVASLSGERSVIVPRDLTPEEKLETLWQERDERNAAAQKVAAETAEKAAVKALHRIITKAASAPTAKPTKEIADGEHSATDPDATPR